MKSVGWLFVIVGLVSCAVRCGSSEEAKGEPEVGKTLDSKTETAAPVPDTAAPPADAAKTEVVPEVVPEVVESFTPADLAALVDQDLYYDDLVFISEPRPPGSEHWQAVQDLCKERFEQLGFETSLHDYGSGVNVIGVKPGVDLPGEDVLISAHYDHIFNCPGADDNGTGVAGVLESARVLSMADYSRTLVVACWDEEELGMVGSYAYALEAKAQADDIVVAYVYEMIGYKSDEPGSQEIPMGFEYIFPEQIAELEENEFKGDFLAIVSDDWAHEPAELIASFGKDSGLPAFVLELTQGQKNNAMFHDLRRSDHSAFWAADYPAMMLTDTANFRNTHYHCKDGPDVVSDLDHEFAAKIISATVYSAAETLGIL